MTLTNFMTVKVVLIDDDPTTNFLNKLILKKSEVAELQREFTVPEEALTYFEQLDISEYPDVIFLDINMPILNGWEFLDAFPVSNLKDTRIIMLTSSINPADEERARAIDHVFDYWSKPLSIEKVVDLNQRL